MFEFLFKYPSAIFSRGTFVFANGWPVWLLWAAIAAAAAVLAVVVWRRSGGGFRATAVWLFRGKSVVIASRGAELGGQSRDVPRTPTICCHDEAHTNDVRLNVRDG